MARSVYYNHEFEAHKNLSQRQFQIKVYYFMDYTVCIVKVVILISVRHSNTKITALPRTVHDAFKNYLSQLFFVHKRYQPVPIKAFTCLSDKLSVNFWNRHRARFPKNSPLHNNRCKLMRYCALVFSEIALIDSPSHWIFRIHGTGLIQTI